MYSHFAPACRAGWSAVVLVLAAMLYATPAAAQHDTHTTAPDAAMRLGSLTVSGVWARATPPAARTGAIYLTIRNAAGEADRLLAAATPAAETAELHTHIVEGGVARMTRVEAVEINPGAPAVFQPGGLHIMLIGLRAPLRDGEHFPLALSFAKAGSVTVDVPVRRTAPSGNQGPAAPGHQH